jgi:hypothetical protein
MKTKSVIGLSPLLLVIGLTIVACNMPGTPPPAPPTALANPGVIGIALNNPYNTSIWYVGNPVGVDTNVIIAAGRSINEVSFLVNGTPVVSIDGSSDSARRFYASGWVPSDPGEYYIQSEVVLSDGTMAISRPNRICVMPIDSPLFRPSTTGYVGPCAVPTHISSSASSGDISISAQVAPVAITIYPDPACSPNPDVHTVRLSITANVNDPQDQVAFAAFLMDQRWSGIHWDLYMNWVTTRPVNQKEYRSFIELPWSVFDGFPSDALPWHIKVYGRDGQELPTHFDGVTPIHVIECSSQHLETSPSATPAPLQIIPSETPTPTPQACIWEAAVNVFLRKGPDVGLFDKLDSVEKGKTLPIIGQSQDDQYWAVQVSPKLTGYVTKADKYSLTSGDCSNVPTLKDPEPPEITLPPTKKPGNNDSSSGVDCSSYTTDSSCNAAPGCSYDYSAKVCK